MSHTVLLSLYPLDNRSSQIPWPALIILYPTKQSQLSYRSFNFSIFLYPLCFFLLYNSYMEILKFRAFSSKESEGFIILRRGPVPQLILQDILFQLFQPLFPNIYCPEVYFFSSTDEILKADQLSKTKDYIYVHFLERVESYVRGGKVREKIKIGSIEAMARGIAFEGTNLYFFSEKQYTMYGREIFRETLSRRVKELSLRQERKLIKYGQYIKQLEQLKDNFEMMKLKDQIKDTVDIYRERVAQVELNYSRYLKIKGILGTVLKNSGINIQTLSDLK